MSDRTAEQEGEQLAAVYEPTLIVGSIWHVISLKFWESWCAYTGFVADAGCVKLPPSGGRPGPIDNGPLLDPAYSPAEGVLRKDAMEGEQYTLIEERAARLLWDWYGGVGPELPREVGVVGVRKRARVDVHPLRFRLFMCDAETGAAPQQAERAKCLSIKSSYSDLQELLHNEVVTAEEERIKREREKDESSMMDAKEPEVKEEAQESRVRLWVRKPKAGVPATAAAAATALVVVPTAAAVSSSSSSASASSSSASAMDVSVEEDHFAAPAAGPKVTEPSDDTSENKEGGAASSSGSADVAMDSFAASLAEPVTSSSSAAASSSSAAASSSSSSSSSAGVGIPNYSTGSSFEREYKANYTKVPPAADSLDEADNARRRLDPSEPGVRTVALPVVPAQDDGWRLLEQEEELMATLEAQELPSVSDVLVEVQQFRLLRDSDGVDELMWVWPRAVFAPQKRWNDFEVGDVLDVMDTAPAWVEGVVLAVKPGAVYIHYPGYVKAWDEWIEVDEGRLAARNTHTTTAVSSNTYSSSSSSTRSYGYTSYSYGASDAGKPEVSGGVGLRNLGNTCFMNSTLQCLSHCVPLTDYFLDDLYKDDLNRTNPLGWGGRVAEDYAKLLKDIWSDLYKVVAPRDLKNTIAEFQPRFEGYAQHDSSELLGFLLDGLHEDLNRVKNKPATTSVDSNGRPDAIVAAESWATYQLRNRSIIIDTFQGQLKSKVTCPIATCGKVSITFDPVQYLSVPLPVAQDTVVTIHLVSADASKPVIQVGAVVSKVASISQLKEAVCAALVAKDAAAAADGSSSSSSSSAAPAAMNPRRLVLADIFSGRVYKFFEDDGSVSDIKSNDVVYAFECPEIDEFIAKESPAGGFYPISVMMQRKEKNPYYNARYNSSASEEYRYSNYALPRVLCLPKKSNVSVRRILDIIHSKVLPHLRVGSGGSASAAPSFAVDSPDAEAAYTVVVTDERGDGCGVHENVGWSSTKCSGCVLLDYSTIKVRDAAAAAASAAKADKTSKAFVASAKNNNARPIPTGHTAFDILSGADLIGDSTDEDESEDEDGEDGDVQVEVKIEGIKSPSDDEEAGAAGGAAVMVGVVTPSPSASPDAGAVLVSKPAEGSDTEFVQVDGEGMTDAAAPAATPAVPARDLDVDFILKTGASYMSYQTDVLARCAFVVRMTHVEPQVVPEVPAASAASPSADAAMEDGSASDPIKVEEPVDAAAAVAASAAAVPAVVAAPYYWFDKDSSDREVAHSSLSDIAKENVEGVTIQDCVRAYVKEETLSEEDPWYCSSCKEHRQATKKFDLWRLPEVLVIHLKRFSYSKYSRDKITTAVNFPLVGLDLNEHTVNPEHQGDVYDLFAVSNHMGGLGGGHYNAYVRNHTDGVWYLHDDSSVSRVRSLNDIRSSSAYVLFYRKRGANAVVKTESEMAAEIATYQSSLPKTSYSAYNYNSSINTLD